MTLEHFEHNLARNLADYVPLSPLSFIKRAARVFPDHPALIYGRRRFRWRETYNHAVCLAHALTQRRVGRGDTVSIIAPNVPALFEAHFGVPMAGAVLNTINTRLDADTIAFCRQHLAGYKTPKRVVFGELPKTATGNTEVCPAAVHT